MRSAEIDCLTNGAPHAPEARSLHEFLRCLAGHAEYDFVRCYVAFDLYNKTKKMQEGDFEIADFRRCLRECTDTARTLARNQSAHRDFLARDGGGGAGEGGVEARTRLLYGALFEDFDERDYYDASCSILQQRLAVNGVAIASGAAALDDGCGGGRFTLALRQMGCRVVHGVDLSRANIETAVRRRDARQIDGVHYHVASVLELPFRAACFDFVFCNGVLHHTRAPIETGLREIHRVLRPGGELFLALMEKPGGVLFDAIELLREGMKDVPLDFAMAALRMLGLRGFRLYSLLDHVMVPINLRSTPQEVEAAIEGAGFRGHRRLLRGLATDRIEKLHRLGGKDPDAIWKYGVGENKYLCVK